METAIELQEKKHDPRKQTWIISYPTTREDITPEMLKSEGIETDEWYQATDASAKHLLIHVSRKFRKDAKRVSQAIANLNKHIANVGDKGNTINGFNEGELLDSHPAFAFIVSRLQSDMMMFDAEPGTTSLQVCIKGSAGIEAVSKYGKKGLLWKYLPDQPKNMSQEQLAAKVAKWTPLVRDAKRYKMEAEAKIKKLEESLDIALAGNGLLQTSLDCAHSSLHRAEEEIQALKKERDELLKRH